MTAAALLEQHRPALTGHCYRLLGPVAPAGGRGPGCAPPRARCGGPGRPPAALLEQHRPALTGHCYRMLGSVVDAEDAVQEAMLRAWKGLDRFQEQSSLKTWLYRIATNVCLDTLSASHRQR